MRGSYAITSIGKNNAMDMIKDYIDGMSIKNIAKKNNIHHATLRNWFNEVGVPPRRKREVKP